jgi:hypothetical protein
MTANCRASSRAFASCSSRSFIAALNTAERPTIVPKKTPPTQSIGCTCVTNANNAVAASTARTPPIPSRAGRTHPAPAAAYTTNTVQIPRNGASAKPMASIATAVQSLDTRLDPKEWK